MVAMTAMNVSRHLFMLPSSALCGTCFCERTFCQWTQQQEISMDWNRVEGNWKQVKGAIKEQWGKLTDDDLDQINGQREQLEGKIQERYGYAKDQTRRDVDDWYGRQTWH
jgi:uncharacterized protein YjbJ (UPF0337 family)